MPFSGTRLNDDLLGVACDGYFTVPINLCRPIPYSCTPDKGGRFVARCPPRRYCQSRRLLITNMSILLNSRSASIHTRGTQDRVRRQMATSGMPGSTPGQDIDVPNNSAPEVLCIMDQVKEVDAALHYLAARVGFLINST